MNISLKGRRFVDIERIQTNATSAPKAIKKLSSRTVLGYESIDESEFLDTIGTHFVLKKASKRFAFQSTISKFVHNFFSTEEILDLQPPKVENFLSVRTLRQLTADKYGLNNVMHPEDKRY